MSPSEEQPCILIIDDEGSVRSQLKQHLERAGFRVLLAEDALIGLQLLEMDAAVNIALVDQHLPAMLGEELISKILEVSPTTLCIGITGQSNAEVGEKMLAAGAEDFLTKPIVDLPGFLHTLNENLKKQAESRETRPVRARLLRQHRRVNAVKALKGTSPAMLELVEEIRALAPLPVPILIRGESGTGKELVATAIHDLSQNKRGPFIPVNCAAIPHELFESELFGHVKGAFTGALQTRTGLCHEAAGGTLFLDEVGELPLPLQAKLLRMLEQRTFRPVGSPRLESLQARVIAATNVNLEEAIAVRAFRQDLYYRVSAQEIWVPPLRERIEDIYQLAFFFIENYNRDFGRQINAINPAALELLKGYSWERNNVRELDREIQRALARCSPTDNELLPEMLFRKRRLLASSAASRSQDASILDGLLELPFNAARKAGEDRILRWYLMHFLRRADGNKTLAARLAHGMQRSHFTRRCKALGIELKK